MPLNNNRLTQFHQILKVPHHRVTPNKEPLSLTDLDGLVLIHGLFEEVTDEGVMLAQSQRCDTEENPEGYEFVELFVTDCILREYLVVPEGRLRFELYHRLDLPAVASFHELRLALRALFLEDQKLRFERAWSKVFPVALTLPEPISDIVRKIPE